MITRLNTKKECQVQNSSKKKIMNHVKRSIDETSQTTPIKCEIINEFGANMNQVPAARAICRGTTENTIVICV